MVVQMYPTKNKPKCYWSNNEVCSNVSSSKDRGRDNGEMFPSQKQMLRLRWHFLYRNIDHESRGMEIVNLTCLYSSQIKTTVIRNQIKVVAVKIVKTRLR